MPRRRLIPLLLLAAFALVAAACGGSGEEDPLPEDESLQAQDSGDDREVPATENQPDSPSDREVPDANATTDAAADDGETDGVERPSAAGPTVEAGDGGGGSTTAPATTADGTYTVQAGDTLGDIAFRFGTTAAVLADLNNLANPNSLTIGQVLVLPGGTLPDEEEEESVAGTDDDGSGDDEGDDPDAGSDDGADDAPPPAPVAGAGLSPGGIPQPGPDVTFEALPERPAALSDFATTALPWIQDRTTPSELEELFIEWSMPPLPQGDRFFLVDTDADGLFSLVAIFTDPGEPQRGPLTDANIVIYDPLPDQPTRWVQAYDHNLANPLPGQNYFVLGVEDVTGDDKRDITYAEEFCGASTCTTVVHVLVRDGDGYRDIASPRIEISTVTTLELADVTGDGLPDLSVEGGTFGSAGAGPPRPFQFIFSAVGDAFIEVVRVGLPTDFQVWVIADGNEAFNAGDYAAALTTYTQAATDAGLDPFIAGAGPDLVALAQLRAAISNLQLGDATAAVAAAQAASTAPGLIGALASAYLATVIAEPDAAAACAALNDVLALQVADWDAFWEQFGFGLPAFQAEQICPF